MNTGINLLNLPHKLQLDVHIKRTQPRPLFQAFGKMIYEVEWIGQRGPPIILLKIDGAKAIREASFYVHLSCHPHIVRTYALVESNPNSLMLLQERAPMGDLGELLRENYFRPTEKVLCEIFVQLCDALIFLAYNGIVHGDLACRNVLVFNLDSNEPTNNLVKLTDFGLTRTSSIYSVVDSSSTSTMNIVPIRYAAPEILQTMDGSNYSEKSDVYSMGVLMWEACSQSVLPYQSMERDEDIRFRKLNNERLPKPESCSPQLWAIINQCWHRRPENRPNFWLLKRSLLTLLFGPPLEFPPGPIQNEGLAGEYLPIRNLVQGLDDRPQPETLRRIERNVDQERQYRTTLNNHQRNGNLNAVHQCIFCHERFGSQAATDEHFLFCSNKTEHCSRCNRYIRRGEYAYHMNNNCASYDELPPQISLRPRSQTLVDNEYRDRAAENSFSNRRRNVLHSSFKQERKHLNTIQEDINQPRIPIPDQSSRNNQTSSPNTANNLYYNPTHPASVSSRIADQVSYVRRETRDPVVNDITWNSGNIDDRRDVPNRSAAMTLQNNRSDQRRANMQSMDQYESNSSSDEDSRNYQPLQRSRSFNIGSSVTGPTGDSVRFADGPPRTTRYDQSQQYGPPNTYTNAETTSQSQNQNTNVRRSVYGHPFDNPDNNSYEQPRNQYYKPRP